MSVWKGEQQIPRIIGIYSLISYLIFTTTLEFLHFIAAFLHHRRNSLSPGVKKLGGPRIKSQFNWDPEYSSNDLLSGKEAQCLRKVQLNPAWHGSLQHGVFL